MEKEDNVNLRSEKVRNIIGQIPPITIRIGLTIILLISLGLFCMAYFITYDYIIKTTGTIEQKNDSTMVEVKVPATLYNKIEVGNQVIISFDNIPNLYGEKIESKVQKLNKNLSISMKGGYSSFEIILTKNIKSVSRKRIIIQDRTKVKIEIITKKVSLFDRIVKSEF